MAQSRRQRDTRAESAARRAKAERAYGRPWAELTTAERRTAYGHRPRANLTEYQEKVIRAEVRNWVSHYNRKAGEAGASERLSPAHERAQVKLFVDQFEKTGFASFKEASAARAEYENTGRFYQVFDQPRAFGETSRDAAMAAFSEQMETELGVTLDPRLDWMLGGPSKRDKEKERERRQRSRDRAARRRIERGAAGRGRRRAA
jgi:hypothetical protein